MTERTHTHILLLGLGLRVQFRPFSPRSLPYLLRSLGWGDGGAGSNSPNLGPGQVSGTCASTCSPLVSGNMPGLTEPLNRRERRGGVGVKLSMTGVV